MTVFPTMSGRSRYSPSLDLVDLARQLFISSVWQATRIWSQGFCPCRLKSWCEESFDGYSTSTWSELLFEHNNDGWVTAHLETSSFAWQQEVRRSHASILIFMLMKFISTPSQINSNNNDTLDWPIHQVSTCFSWKINCGTYKRMRHALLFIFGDV